MKKQWNNIRLALMLFALPLVATAAASAHNWAVESSPISIETPADNAAIGLARVHTIALNENGGIDGRIAALGEATATGIGDLKIFFIQDGEVVKESASRGDGSFVVSEIAEGDYSFVATGENGFAAYGVRVVSHGTADHGSVMEVAAMASGFDSLKTIFDQKLPKSVVQEIASSDSNTNQKVLGSHRVVLDNGTLKGSVVSLSGTSAQSDVFIIRDDVQVAEVQTNENGEFSVSDLDPGVYGFVSIGENGFSAIGFEAVELTSNPVDTDEVSVAALTTYQELIPPAATLSSGAVPVLQVVQTPGQNQPFFDEGPAFGQPAFETVPVETFTETVAFGPVTGGPVTQTVGTAAPRRLGAVFGGSGRGRLLALIGAGVAIPVAIATGGDDDGAPASPATP